MTSIRIEIVIRRYISLLSADLTPFSFYNFTQLCAFRTHIPLLTISLATTFRLFVGLVYNFQPQYFLDKMRVPVIVGVSYVIQEQMDF